jgi:hypothetical protein
MSVAPKKADMRPAKQAGNALPNHVADSHHRNQAKKIEKRRIGARIWNWQRTVPNLNGARHH